MRLLPVRAGWVLTATCLAAVLLAAGGCSPFERDWKALAAAPPPADQITGRWEGTWRSEKDNHSGALRCIIERDETGYLARYHAVWWEIFTFEHTLHMSSSEEGAVRRLQGEADLGSLAGGVYRYEARVTPTSFFSTYRSSRDHGRYEMWRPEAAPAITPATPQAAGGRDP